MFWIILTIGSLCLGLATMKKNEDGTINITTFSSVNSMLATCSIILLIIQGCIGMDKYPSLAKELAQITALEKRVEDIKGASYTYQKDGEFIAGSIENYQQSTNLSKYIAELAKKEATYNGRLAEAKLYKEVFPLYFFGHGWAISDRVYELREIK